MILYDKGIFYKIFSNMNTHNLADDQSSYLSGHCLNGNL